MSEKFQDKYRIPSTLTTSLKQNSNAACYFTICTRNHHCYFGNVVNGKMKLSNIGILADVFLYELKNHTKNIELVEFVVMPNHIHGLFIFNENNEKANENKATNKSTGINKIHSINGHDVFTVFDLETAHALSIQLPELTKKINGQKQSQNQGKNTISSIIDSYKTAVFKHAHRLGYDFAWQTRFQNHIIKDEEEYQLIVKNIKTNAVNWKDDKFNTTKNLI